MEHALNVAKEALSAGEVPVGCIFVYNNNIIATGKNSVNETKNATRHAEMNCIDEVIKNYIDWKKVFLETHVIVTVEPCIMCAAALHDLKIGSITYGCANDRFGGCISVFDASKMYSKPCKVTGGVCADEAMSLLKTFYKGTNPNAPESKVKKKKKES